MKSLSELRKDIDEIDNKIIGLLAERMKVVEDVILTKKSLNISVIDTKRESGQYHEWQEKAKELGLDPEHISKILEDIIAMSVDFQKKKL